MEFYLAFTEYHKQTSEKIIQAKKMNVMDAEINGFEAYQDEFEAIAALYYSRDKKLKRSQLIAVYKAHTNSFIKLSSNEEEKYIITEDTKFKKINVEPLSLLIDYL